MTLQDDMRLVGIADIVFDYRIRLAVERRYPVYASLPEKRDEMAAAGIPVAGALDDLLRRTDVVVDCAPKRVASQNRRRSRPSISGGSSTGYRAVQARAELRDPVTDPRLPVARHGGLPARV